MSNKQTNKQKRDEDEVDRHNNITSKHGAHGGQKSFTLRSFHDTNESLFMRHIMIPALIFYLNIFDAANLKVLPLY